jgi:acetyltransferase EpsM
MYLYGGGHSKVIAEILESMGKTISVSLMIINALKKLGTKVEKGIRISGENFPVLESPVIISIGNNERAEIAELLTNFDVKFGKAIHSTAIISPSVSIAEGVMILHGSIIQADTIIGKHVLVKRQPALTMRMSLATMLMCLLMLHYAEEFMWEKEHILVVLWFYPI